MEFAGYFFAALGLLYLWRLLGGDLPHTYRQHPIEPWQTWTRAAGLLLIGTCMVITGRRLRLREAEDRVSRPQQPHAPTPERSDPPQRET